MTSKDLLLGMTPSSMALSLINCNPIVANDPILNSSLTSLATQILHMEHLIQVYMVSSKPWTTGPYRKSGPVRILVRGPDFWSEICWSGPWSGFSVRIFVGPVRGPEFGPDSNLVRSVVRILVRKNPYRGGFFFGPVRGPDQNFEKLKKYRVHSKFSEK